MKYKLTPEEAGNKIVEHWEKVVKTRKTSIIEIQNHIDSLRKNAKNRKSWERQLSDEKERLKRDEKKLENSKEIKEKAEEIWELTLRIGILCEERRNLTPNNVSAEVELLSMMRNGFF